jgi:hypothetical protein
MSNIEGFGFFEKQKLKSALRDARKCLDSALMEAFSNHDKFQVRLKSYFTNNKGGTDATNHLIMKTINSMKIMIDSDKYVVKRAGSGAKPGTNAEADNLPQQSITFGGTDFRKARTARYQGTCIYEGKRVNSLEGIMSYAESHARPELIIYDNYFALPYKINGGQGQVETFLHELSHVAAGTHDIDAPKCYGYKGVMYCMQQGTATSNAENYGMFLTSYLL